MSKPPHENIGKPSSSREDAYQYRKERHAAHIEIRNNLDDLAFKTSERYDQWVMTLAGGALAISLTLIEKIAPEPTPFSWVILGLSWLAYIIAILAGLGAIYYSRKAIYRAIEICDEEYGLFVSSSTEENPGGNAPPKLDNRFNRFVEIINRVSLWCLGAGTVLMCIFGLINLGGRVSTDTGRPKEMTVNVNLKQVHNSSETETNGMSMSKEGNKTNQLQGVTPTKPDGALKGVSTGDTGSVKGSYKTPTSQAPPPPPPKK